MSYGEYDDLDSFGGDWRPQQAFRPGLDTLADGDYDFTIIDAALDKVQSDRILRIGLRTAQGSEVEWTHWLNKQESANRLCADFCLLGFDADKWGGDTRPLSVELPRAVGQLPGIRFRGTKRARQNREKTRTFHDLYISGRIGRAPMPRAATPSQAAPAGNSDIPF